MTQNIGDETAKTIIDNNFDSLVAALEGLIKKSRSVQQLHRFASPTSLDISPLSTNIKEALVREGHEPTNEATRYLGQLLMKKISFAPVILYFSQKDPKKVVAETDGKQAMTLSLYSRASLPLLRSLLSSGYLSKVDMLRFAIFPSAISCAAEMGEDAFFNLFAKHNHREEMLRFLAKGLDENSADLINEVLDMIVSTDAYANHPMAYVEYAEPIRDVPLSLFHKTKAEVEEEISFPIKQFFIPVSNTLSGSGCKEALTKFMGAILDIYHAIGKLILAFRNPDAYLPRQCVGLRFFSGRGGRDKQVEALDAKISSSVEKIRQSLGELGCRARLDFVECCLQLYCQREKVSSRAERDAVSHVLKESFCDFSHLRRLGLAYAQ